MPTCARRTAGAAIAAIPANEPRQPSGPTKRRARSRPCGGWRVGDVYCVEMLGLREN